MTKRTKATAKKQKGARTTKPFTAPYWFDRARSLTELEGLRPPLSSGWRTGLIERFESALETPVRDLSETQIHLLLTQGHDPHYLVPVAIESTNLAMVADGPGSYELGCLLVALLTLPVPFWSTHPYLHDLLVELCSADPDALTRCAPDVRMHVEYFVGRAASIPRPPKRR